MREGFKAIKRYIEIYKEIYKEITTTKRNLGPGSTMVLNGINHALG